jgi:hypothetical protein
MLSLGASRLKTCQGLTRRDVLQVAGIELLGLSLANQLRARTAADPVPDSSGRSCIFLWLDGGPSHFETWDPKPDTPDTIRGPYGTISTSVAGTQVSELLPLMSERMHKVSLIRSMNHGIDSHSPIPMMTGLPGETTSHGAVVTKLHGFTRSMPPYVHIGSRLGVGAGNLGAPYNPVEVPDPTGSQIQLPDFALRADIKADRFLQRRELLASIDRLRADALAGKTIERMDAFYQSAANMLTSEKVRIAFDLNREDDSLRDRYGNNFFGQSCLMARRLVEAGTRFVQIKWYDGPAWDAWDVHGADLGGMERMEHHLCPRLDQGLSALLDDLEQRGLLASTLIVVIGEFGRTPNINKYGARDHWPYCFSALLAGAGVPGGAVVGSSDKTGARPARRPVSPAEFAATIYKRLGIDTVNDPRIRPFIREAIAVTDL